MSDDGRPASGAAGRLRSSSPAALAASAVSKSFGGVTVLDRFSLNISPGEIHGLVGENGSGKSTLVKVLAGIHAPDPGSEVTVWGQPLRFPVTRPQSYGVAVVHQDMGLVDTMTVAENIGVSSSFGARALLPIHRRSEIRIAEQTLGKLGITIDPRNVLGDLAPTERAAVGIARALRECRHQGEGQFLILDEPTAALPSEESRRLLEIIRNLAREGGSVLLIGHRLKEVLEVCDRITILRNGSKVATVAADKTSERQVVASMLGYELENFYPKSQRRTATSEVLRVEEISGRILSEVTFSVLAGEVVGVTGLSGMGHDELPYLVTGFAPRRGGSVAVDGRHIGRGIRAALAAGVSLVPGNRQRDALWMQGTAQENLTIPFLKQLTTPVGLYPRRQRFFAAEQMKKFDVRPRRLRLLMQNFSGGNQQKIVLSRSLASNPRVLVLHEPTQGVDVGAKRDLHQFIRNAAEDGAGVLMCSSDAEEIAESCDRVLILRFGKIVSVLDRSELSRDRLAQAVQ
jgi:ribose transport system ATP-binding protein